MANVPLYDTLLILSPFLLWLLGATMSVPLLVILAGVAFLAVGAFFASTLPAWAVASYFIIGIFIIMLSVTMMNKKK